MGSAGRRTLGLLQQHASPLRELDRRLDARIDVGLLNSCEAQPKQSAAAQRAGTNRPKEL